MNDLTETLAGLRRFKNISCDVIGNAMGKSGATVGRMETKVIGFDVENVQKYADAIGVKVTVKLECEGFSIEVPLSTPEREG